MKVLRSIFPNFPHLVSMQTCFPFHLIFLVASWDRDPSTATFVSSTRVPSFTPLVSGCGLLLSEIFLDEDRRGPSRGLLQALSMSEGRQRSAAEYCRLLEGHGFVSPRARHTGNALDALLATRA